MKSLLYYLAGSALFLSGAISYAQLPGDITRFRMNSLRGDEGSSGVNFLDAQSWNQYQPPQWTTIDEADRILPWNYFASGSDINLKMDWSTAYIDTDFNVAGVRLTGMYNSTLNIINGAHVTFYGSIEQDANSIVNLLGTSTLTLTSGDVYVGEFNAIGTDDLNRVTLNGRMHAHANGHYTLQYVNWNSTGNSNMQRANARYDISNTTWIHNDGNINLEGGGTFMYFTDSIIKHTGWEINIRDGSVLSLDNTSIENDGPLNIENGTFSLTNGSAYTQMLRPDNSWQHLNIRTSNNNGDTVALFEIGDNVVISSRNWNFGRDNATSGTATVHFNGENSTASVINLESSSSSRTGGDSLLLMEGKNNSITIAENTNLDGHVNNSNTIDGGSVGVEIRGEGNSFIAERRIAIGAHDGNGIFYAGSSFFKITSTNVGNRATLDVKGQITLGLSSDEYSTYETLFQVGSNTDVYVRNGDGSGWDNITVGRGNGSGSIYGGTAKMEVVGDNNILEFNNLYIISGMGDLGGGTSYFTVSGSDNQFSLHSEMRVGSNLNGVYGGTAIMDISGDRNSFDMTTFRIGSNNSNIDGDGMTVTVNVSGDENVFNMSSFLVGSESNYVYAGDIKLNVSGDGNVFNIGGALRIGQSNNVEGGSTYVGITGSNNSFNLSGEMNIGKGENSYADYNDNPTRHVLSITGTGNSFIAADSYVRVGNADGSDAMQGELIIGGKGNEFVLKDLRLGSGTVLDDATSRVSGIFRVQGGGNTITINSYDGWSAHAPGLSGLERYMDAYDDGKFSRGAWIIFEFDADGITTIDAVSANLGQTYILLDFNSMSVQIAGDFYVLITSGTAYSDRIMAILSDGNMYAAGEASTNGDFFEIIDRGEGGGVEIFYAGLIPEPSTYAAIFGAIALAFAAYRRKRS